MKLDNILDFTENHCFYVFREFALSSLDDKVLSSIYQPMIGAGACGLYKLLYQQLPADRLGFSRLDQQRKLFLSLGTEPGDKGRRFVADCASRLEAVGLLQTYRKQRSDQEEYVFLYHMQPPMNPYEFFRNQHLALLLRDHIGRHAVLQLHEEFCSPEPEETREHSVSESISVPFYDLFELSTQVIDYEFEQALAEMAPAMAFSPKQEPKLDGFTYSDIIVQFPRLSHNRSYVERLNEQPDELQAINYVAGKYRLTLQETCRLLDEDHVFTAKGELDLDTLQHLASLIFRQGKKREEDRERKLQSTSKPRPTEQEKPVADHFFLEVPEFLQGQCDVGQYNMFLRNKPYLDILELIFPGKIPDHILNIFERIDLHYKLPEEVINVLIHFLKTANKSWSKAYVESIVSDMLGKQIETYEEAVSYIREQEQFHAGAKKSGSARGANRRSSQSSKGREASGKPKLSVYQGQDEPPLTDEEYENILRKVRERAGK